MVDLPANAPEGAIELELCEACFCMTWTMEDRTCGKCGASK